MRFGNWFGSGLQFNPPLLAPWMWGLLLGVPVVHYRPRHLALSTEHPMHCGWDPHALLKEADVVLVVDCDVLRADGGLATGRDIVMAAMLGADEMSFGTSAMIAEADANRGFLNSRTSSEA
jgi:hypothetical protein